MARGRPLDVVQELLEAFKHSGRVTEYLVRVLPAGIWRTAPRNGRGRSIAAIVAHMQDADVGMEKGSLMRTHSQLESLGRTL